MMQRFKKQIVTLVLTFLIVSWSSIAFAQNNQLFEQGEAAYKAQNYQEAINAWMQILENEKHSASVYFNLGNAHYKLNHVGPSVYYYEKALQLSPNDSDIKTNLAFAENARVDAIEPLPKTVFQKWYASVAGLYTYDGWAIASVVFIGLFVLLFLLYYFSVSERKKRLLFIGAMLSLLFFIVGLVMAFQTYGDYTNNKPAIVFAETSEIKSGPSLGSDDAFVLHEGTKVQILDEDENWLRIQIIDGKDGWIPASDVKRL